ncbi:hypothetical protein GOV14_05365 [Candidatus Pacearchaeota archaeon]|nr:hypothetical protein [Candidatus Pacearchaeota archaeon]
MGDVISSKVLNNNNILYKIQLESNEVQALGNAIRNINLFSSKLCINPAQIIKKGNQGVTQYFSIPFVLRFRKTKDYQELYYQKLETPSKIFYMYVLPKRIL